MWSTVQRYKWPKCDAVACGVGTLVKSQSDEPNLPLIYIFANVFDKTRQNTSIHRIKRGLCRVCYAVNICRALRMPMNELHYSTERHWNNFWIHKHLIHTLFPAAFFLREEKIVARTRSHNYTDIWSKFMKQICEMNRWCLRSSVAVYAPWTAQMILSMQSNSITIGLTFPHFL